jgi:DNA-directed RNA polymerase subunit RPC12/RpoP
MCGAGDVVVSQIQVQKGITMALINCPECLKEISDRADNCPQCGFPIAKQAYEAKPDIPISYWISEEKNRIFVKCPKCNLIGKVNREDTVACKTGYKLDGEGECTCGFVFKEIYKDGRVRCPNCGSHDFSVQKEGFDTGSACCGAFLLGPFGLLCGADKSNQLNRHCLACGHKWKIGK